MSDLRVTDVQAALRHFQGLGHDILTDPSAVHMDGVPYRMALAHRLNMGSREEPSLKSHIAQLEAPIISEVHTISPRSRTNINGFELGGRRVAALIPMRSSDSPDWYDEHPDYNVGSHGENSWAPKGSVLWTPGKNNSPYKDIHEALRQHTEQHDSYKPFRWEMGKERQPLTQEEFRGFNHNVALENTLEGATPHKGLVVVNHVTGKDHKGDDVWSRSLYDMHSEQLLPHDWTWPK
jgi:hypothetical protein